MAPLLVLFQTDRLFFLHQFRLLPVPARAHLLCFRRQAGVAGRVAWSWMWLLPSGFCFVLQAASMGNDSFAAVYFLAALRDARRAREGSPFLLALSIGIHRAGDGRQGLEWFRWSCRGWRCFGSRAVRCSPPCVPLRFSPPVLLAVDRVLPSDGGGEHSLHRQLHRRSGQQPQAANRPIPVAGVIGNGLEIVTANLAPPGLCRANFAGRTRTGSRISFPRATRDSASPAPPIQLDESAGIGPRARAAFAGRRDLRSPASRAAPAAGACARQGAWLLAGSIALAWLGYMAKMGSEAAPAPRGGLLCRGNPRPLGVPFPSPVFRFTAPAGAWPPPSSC